MEVPRLTAQPRQAVASDIAGIQRVRRSVRENRLVSSVITDDDVREAIEESGRGWVVESEGQVVAFAIGNARTGNIWALFVHPEHEGRGHGRRLHDAMVSWLWSRGLDRLWLTTEPRTRAQRFYEAAGWQLVGPTDRGELRYEARPSARRKGGHAFVWRGTLSGAAVGAGVAFVAFLLDASPWWWLAIVVGFILGTSLRLHASIAWGRK
jgi:GNAT superfamily N-acetyltransferase